MMRLLARTTIRLTWVEENIMQHRRGGHGPDHRGARTLHAARLGAKALGAIVFIGAAAGPASGQLTPALAPIFDWNIRSYHPSFPVLITPIPLPGHSLIPSDGAGAIAAYTALKDHGYPLGIMLLTQTAPRGAGACPGGVNDPDALPNTLQILHEEVHGIETPVTFVFADFEDELSDCRVQAMVDLVRGDSFHEDAFIGNYAYYPGAYDFTAPEPPVGWVPPGPNDPWPPTREDASEFYLDSGMNVAMPHAYPYEAYVGHAGSCPWPECAPTERSALFWAPLERASVAERSLPADHLLIPWVAGFVPYSSCPDEGDPCYFLSHPCSCEPTGTSCDCSHCFGCNEYEWFFYGDPPPRIDMQALVMHLRLRGADGYYTLSTGVEDAPAEDRYCYDHYRVDMLDAWTSLNWVFDPTGSSTCAPEFMNLETSKASGLQWSGVVCGDTAVVLISNLGTEPAAAVYSDPNTPGDLDTWQGGSCTLYPNTHVLEVYDLSTSTRVSVTELVYGSPCAGDIDRDEDVDIDDLFLVINPRPADPCSGLCPCDPADLDGNGQIDIDDLFIVVGAMGVPCFDPDGPCP
jgi:hypothetical protein